MDEIRTLKVEEMDVSLDLSCFAFQYELTEKERAERKVFAKPELTWGYFVDNKLAAKMTIHPIQTYINGKAIAVGGVASVATWPEYRRKGMVSQLLTKGLQVMKDEGRTLSFLHPFSIPFYRKFGWELYTDYIQYELRASNLPVGVHSSGSVERVKRDEALLHEIYSAYARQYNGMLVRDERWWNQVVFKQKKGQAVLYRDVHGHAQGYMLYEVNNKQFKVGELIALNLDAWYGLWKFIANHDSMFETITVKAPADDPLPFLLHNPTVKQETVPYFMARIVDVLGFLEQAVFHATGDSLSFKLKLEDRYASWNDGWFSLVLSPEGKVQASRMESAAHVTDEALRNEEGVICCDIQALSAMLVGYKRPSSLHRYGRLHASVNTIDTLERIIPRNSTYLSDYF
ncbi:MAG: hypothetical protein K0Q73_5990 [Paenibacillus sp.]|nr:hypothetical protein [Paenibacillus sp.]